MSNKNVSNKRLGSILLANLVSNSHALQYLNKNIRPDIDTKNAFSSLPAPYLYSRLVSDIDFARLSERDKSLFTFLAPQKEGKVDKMELKNNEMVMFMQEAHNRTCMKLGVKPTEIVYCPFSKNKLLAGPKWVTYDAVTDLIYVDIERDYTKQRPTLLLENINSATRHHATYTNVFKAISNPDSLSDKEYFLSLSVALKSYVYEQLLQTSNDEYNDQLSKNHYMPDMIEFISYGYNQTRKDFQNSGMYGGKIRKDMRKMEKLYYDQLQDGYLVESLMGMEDVMFMFKNSPLNKSSNNVLGNILDKLDKDISSSFYNSYGADMKPGQSIEEYLNCLEKDMLDHFGLEDPSSEEMQNFGQSRNDEIIAHLQEQYEAEERYFNANSKDGVLSSDQNECFQIEMFNDGYSTKAPYYKKTENALPEEGKLNVVDYLPFHNYPEQGTGQ